MYSYFKGIVTIINSKGITVEVNNIGYQVIVANPFSFSLDEEIVLYLYQVVRDDSLLLYGFEDILQKDLFTDLISVTGIGPKSALAITGSADIENLKKSIVLGDEQYLQRFPKVGKKSASQIVLDLKSKYEKQMDEISSEMIDDNSETIEALTSLGYSEKEINKYLKNIDTSLKTEEKIKEILRLMMKK